MASIDKRPGVNQVHYRARIRTRWHTVPKTFARKTEAKLWASQIEAALVAGTYQTAGRNTLAAAIDCCIAEVLPGEKGPGKSSAVSYVVEE